MNNKAHAALAQLTDEQWAQMISELGRYALSVSNKLHWRTGNPDMLPGGETYDSIVSRAIEKVLTGKRRWDPQQDPDLKRYLMDVIDSLLNHLATGKENTLLTRMPRSGSEAGAAWEAGTPTRQPDTAWLAQPALPPEAALLAKEEAQRNDRVLARLIQESSTDPELTQIIRAMQDGYGKAGEIAQVTGIPVTEVYNAMKRLDRKVIRVRQHLQELERPQKEEADHAEATAHHRQHGTPPSHQQIEQRSRMDDGRSAGGPPRGGSRS